MSEDFYTKRGRYRTGIIKYYENNSTVRENFSYQSVGEFVKILHEYYHKFTVIDNFLWCEVIFWTTKGHQKVYSFQSIFEFYSFYSGILIAGELI